MYALEYRYPLILSIENHCSRRQQRVMANNLKQVFGSMIVNDNAIPYEDCTPEKLKRRIILKCKRFAEEGDHSTDPNSSVRHDTPEILQDAVKTQKMYMAVDGTEWRLYLVSLTKASIKSVEIPELKTQSKHRNHKHVSIETLIDYYSRH